MAPSPSARLAVAWTPARYCSESIQSLSTRRLAVRWLPRHPIVLTWDGPLAIRWMFGRENIPSLSACRLAVRWLPRHPLCLTVGWLQLCG